MTRQYKQPHEDVTGIDRSDNDLLSLDERAVAHRDLVINLVGHLRTACMVGNPAPIVDRMAKRLRSPQPGDLVVAYMADMRKPDNRLKGFGYLVERRREWWETDEEWERIRAEEGYEDDGERTTDDAWYVQYGPAAGDVCRWTNCDFTMVPAQARESFDLLFGSRNDEGGIEVTRNDLLSSLADSGITLKLPRQS